MRNIYLIIAKQIVKEAGHIIKEARETNTFSFQFKEDDTPEPLADSHKSS
jgi:myo-inositol-1(or 4)-monophosphatase